MSIYLDNAATTFPKPDQVYRAVEHALIHIGVAPGRGGYRRGIEATRLVFEAREAVAQLFGVGDSSRIVFTHSATESLNLAVGGLLRAGDHVVSTTMEHNSLVRPLHRAAQQGVEVTWVEGDRSGFVDSRRIGAAIRPNTRLVALSHCSNVTGVIQPVGEIGPLARQAGALFLVDAAQSAGCLPIDVAGMAIDLLAAPGHKGLYGVQGTGFLYVTEGVELTPLLVGGSGGHSTGPEPPETMPDRFESGTLNTPGIAGLKAGVEFIRETGIENIRNRENALVGQLLAGLREMPAVTIHGPDAPERRGGVVSFTVAGCDPGEIGFRLDQDYDISVRVGLHCAYSAHRTIGTYPAGTVRVSPGYFNSEEEIAALLKALRKIVAG
ncbi:MAG: aminotransferase class V-fold PLP-dependent enzyme [Geobacteraceae bacterium]|nr:aminotransferase class V-fold PLP-dependent enzyme [Geobacteraceae bacterium]